MNSVTINKKQSSYIQTAVKKQVHILPLVMRLMNFIVVPRNLLHSIYGSCTKSFSNFKNLS